MFAFCLVRILGRFVGRVVEGVSIHNVLVFVAYVASWVVSIATLYCVCRWRQKHRLVPGSLLVLEVLLGFFLAGAAFLFTFGLWGFAALN